MDPSAQLYSEWITHAVGLFIIGALAWFVKKDRATLDQEIKHLRDNDKSIFKSQNGFGTRLSIAEFQNKNLEQKISEVKDTLDTLGNKIDTVLIAVGNGK
jgi:hypothetical protein